MGTSRRICLSRAPHTFHLQFSASTIHHHVFLNVIRARHLDLVRTVHAQVPASRRKISP